MIATCAIGAIWDSYLTVSVPYIPAARCPGAWQKNV